MLRRKCEKKRVTFTVNRKTILAGILILLVCFCAAFLAAAEEVTVGNMASLEKAVNEADHDLLPLKPMPC